MLTAFPQCNFSREFLEIISQNHTRYHYLLSVSGIFKVIHCRILNNIPYYFFMILITFFLIFVPIGYFAALLYVAYR